MRKGKSKKGFRAWDAQKRGMDLVGSEEREPPHLSAALDLSPAPEPHSQSLGEPTHPDT